MHIMDCLPIHRGHRDEGKERCRIDSSDLDPQVLKELKEAFILFDKNGDGTITSDELEAVMLKIGQRPTQDELETMIRKKDLNKDGRIDFEEFVNMMAHRNKKISVDEEMKEAFDVFDQDSDGFIDRGELKSVMDNLGVILTESELDQMMEEADLNRDGLVDFPEFEKVMRPKRNKSRNNDTNDSRRSSRTGSRANSRADSIFLDSRMGSLTDGIAEE